MIHPFRATRGPFAAAVFLLLSLALPAAAQDAAAPPDAPRVETDAPAPDERIAARIAEIVAATGWFRDVAVTAEDGVVFLDGATDSIERRDWAEALALRTDGAVAVVNRIEVIPDVSWSLAPALDEIRRLADRTLAALPLVGLALLILPLAWLAARLVARILRWLMAGRVRTPFLRDVVARAIAIPVFLMGLYVVLQVAGLTQLALSVVGGAGVVGIVIGFAFRDIAENLLASLLLSVRRPFDRGDLIVVSGCRGFVQSMNTRSTVLVSEEGNHIQIPNAVVFKSIIENLTAAPSQRGELSVGIGYDARASDAQALILEVLRRNAAVEDHPEPMALIDTLGAATVNMKGYYWFDGRTYSPLKLRSMLLRQVKSALTAEGISMPDEAREVIFPQGVPVVGAEAPPPPGPSRPAPERAAQEIEVSDAERDLSTEMRDLDEQMATPVETRGTDLLRS